MKPLTGGNTPYPPCPQTICERYNCLNRYFNQGSVIDCGDSTLQLVPDNSVLQILRQIKASFQRPYSHGHRMRSTTAFSTSDPRPISWVIPGKLAVGRLPQQKEVMQLVDEGIKAVLSLCAESEGRLPDEIQQYLEHDRIVLPDSHYSQALDVSQLAQAVDRVQQRIENGLPVYVHCLAGIERSPTVCVAYLCRYYHLELWESMNWLKQVHASSMPTASQTVVLREFIEQYCQEQS